MVARYVKRNPLRARLVRHVENRQWSSLWRRTQEDARLTVWFSDWPVTRPQNWVVQVNCPETAEELEALHLSVQRGRLFGDEAWIRRMARWFGMKSTLRPRGTTERFLHKDSQLRCSSKQDIRIDDPAVHFIARRHGRRSPDGAEVGYLWNQESHGHELAKVASLKGWEVRGFVRTTSGVDGGIVNCQIVQGNFEELDRALINMHIRSQSAYQTLFGLRLTLFLKLKPLSV